MICHGLGWKGLEPLLGGPGIIKGLFLVTVEVQVSMVGYIGMDPGICLEVASKSFQAPKAGEELPARLRTHSFD